MNTQRLWINQILTEKYGHPMRIQFVFNPGITGADFSALPLSWLGVYDEFQRVWRQYAGVGDFYVQSLTEPPQFTPRRFFKRDKHAAPPALKEFFAELMVKYPDEAKVPSTEGWEDLV